jgi:hypothetical protein
LTFPECLFGFEPPFSHDVSRILLKLLIVELADRLLQFGIALACSKTTGQGGESEPVKTSIQIVTEDVMSVQKKSLISQRSAVKSALLAMPESAATRPAVKPAALAAKAPAKSFAKAPAKAFAKAPAKAFAKAPAKSFAKAAAKSFAKAPVR